MVAGAPATVVGDEAVPAVVLPGAEPGVVLPGAVPLGVVVVAPGSAAATHWYTGRNVTMPADVDGVEGIALVAHPGQVDDDVRTLHPHVGLGDASPFELVADQVADDEEVVTGGVAASGRG